MICGKEIDVNEEPLLAFRCKECTKKSGVMVECIWCKHMNLFKTPPCNFDFVILENDKCIFHEPPFSTADIVRLARQYPYLFGLVN